MRRTTRSGLIVVVLLAAAAALGGPEETHTASVKTKHFEIYYRPGSRAGAAVDRISVVAERDLARICELLEIPVDGRYKLYLYDGVPELLAITGTTGNAGFSAGDASHVPYGSDQTRFHEMVHIVAVRLKKSGDEPRNLFFAEGLANALLEHVHGVHVHAVAAYYLRGKKLPALKELTGGDFYAWLRKNPGVNGYDIGASWIRHLLDAHGAAKVRRYYTGTPAADAFGQPQKKLEAAWRAMLKGLELRPEAETLLRQRHGEEVEFRHYPLDPQDRLPPEIGGKPEQWKDLTGAALRPDVKANWSNEDGRIRGTNKTPQWTWCGLGKRKYGNCAVRVVVTPAAGTLGVAVRFSDAVQALLVQNGTFHYENGKAVRWNNKKRLTAARTHIVVVRRGSEMQIWLNGFLVLTSRMDKKAAPLAIGVAAGTATFENVAVRVLKP